MTDLVTNVTLEAQGNTGSPEGGAAEPQGSQTPSPDFHQDTPQAAQAPAGEPKAAPPATDRPEGEIASPETAQELEGAGDDAGQLPADPSGYKVPLPEGVDADPVLVEGLKRYAHRNGWTQDQVNGMAEFWGGYIEFQKKQHGKQLKSWDNEIRADWGRDYAANRKTALRGLNVAGEKVGAELVNLLNQSGMTNHPAVNRLLYAVGQLMSEDTFVRGASKPVTVRRDEEGRPIMQYSKM